jgi:hypothetical protein
VFALAELAGGATDAAARAGATACRGSEALLESVPEAEIDAPSVDAAERSQALSGARRAPAIR